MPVEEGRRGVGPRLSAAALVLGDVLKTALRDRAEAMVRARDAGLGRR